MKKIYKITMTIVPNRMILNKKVFKIYELDRDYIIEKYFIHSLDDRIQAIELDSYHPNCDPNTRLFCIPKSIENKEISDDRLTLLEKTFRTFNLDNCYYAPWRKFKYE